MSDERRKTYRRSLDSQELAIVLAGLRLWQHLAETDSIPSDIRDISTDSGSFPCLSQSGIDELAEVLKYITVIGINPARTLSNLRTQLADLGSRVKTIESRLEAPMSDQEAERSQLKECRNVFEEYQSRHGKSLQRDPDGRYKFVGQEWCEWQIVWPIAYAAGARAENEACCRSLLAAASPKRGYHKGETEK